MKHMLAALGFAGAGLCFVLPAQAQPAAGPAVCKIAAESEADNWAPAVSMMDIILENPEQTAEQRANAESHRAEAVVMRDAALELAARFKGAVDPTPEEVKALSAMDEDQFYDLLDTCDAMEDAKIAALMSLERGRAMSAEADAKLKEALDDLEGQIAYSSAVANDYATRVNCAAAHTAFANSFARENRESAVYKRSRQWADALLENVYQIAGNQRRADNDILGVYTAWTKNLSGDFRMACVNLLIVDGDRQVIAMPAPAAPKAQTQAAAPAPPPAQPKNLFPETVWLGDEVFKSFAPDSPGFMIGFARYGEADDRQVLLLQLLPSRQGNASMIAHQYSVNCKTGTIWWMQQRMLDDGGSILGVVVNASSPQAPDNALGHAILNATCKLGFTRDPARSASGWRETAPIR